MTAQQIKDVSYRHFAQNGYEGASLAHIAEDVGIKKQSIYTHFKGKDELFLVLCEEARTNELTFVANYIKENQSQTLKEFLLSFLKQSITRYEQNQVTRFWIRTAFFPPRHLSDVVLAYVYEYLDQLEEQFIPVFVNAKNQGETDPAIHNKQATTAFIAILDSILVEMLYGGPIRLQKRLHASWEVYWRGITKNENVMGRNE